MEYCRIQRLERFAWNDAEKDFVESQGVFVDLFEPFVLTSEPWS